jgi:hypothetical protein
VKSVVNGLGKFSAIRSPEAGRVKTRRVVLGDGRECTMVGQWTSSASFAL